MNEAALVLIALASGLAIGTISGILLSIWLGARFRKSEEREIEEMIVSAILEVDSQLPRRKQRGLSLTSDDVAIDDKVL